MNLNKVILIGRLTADPQLRTTASGMPVTSFSLATNRVWTNKSGEKQEDTEFHNIVVWARQAEIVNQFLKKGSLAMVEGRLQTRSWQDKDGNNRKTTEVVAERIQFGPRSQSNSIPNRTSLAEENKKNDVLEINIDEEGEEIKGEDIPF